MKRSLNSSIFSVKKLGIILLLILGFFSLNSPRTQASILVDIKLDNKNTKILDTYKNNFWVATLGYNSLSNNLRVETNETPIVTGVYTVKPLDTTKVSEVQSLVKARVQTLSQEVMKSESSIIYEFEKRINAITDNSYPEAKEYLLDVMSTSRDMAGNYFQIYDVMKNHDDDLNVYQESSVNNVIEKSRRIFLYRSMNAFLTNGSTTLDTNRIPETLKALAQEIREEQETEKINLSDAEKNTGQFYYHQDLQKRLSFKTPSLLTGGEEGGGGGGDPEMEIETDIESEVCNATSVGKILTSTNPNCSIAAFMVNSLLNLISGMFGIFVGLVGGLFDWVIQFSIYNFNDWVLRADAYEVWRNIVLALVTSLILPLVLYLIIRMLIDDNSDQIKKLLPRILFTALFVYFSFSIVGWIIDQSNLFSIYIYRSMHSPDQSIGESLRTLLYIDGGSNTAPLGVTSGGWESTPYHFIKIIVNLVALLVLLQGLVLLFVRAVTLLLVIIFSPIMLLPAGIHGQIDQYREMVIKHFTNAILMAPVFMFMLMIAMKVGEAGTNTLENNLQLNSITPNASAYNISPNFMGITISAIISIIILQLAISTAKKMSAEIGGQIAGKVSGFAGNLAFGGASKVMKLGVNTAANNKRFQGWMQKNEGTRRGKLATNLMNAAKSSTYDVRNIKGFDTAMGSKNAFGQGSRTTAKGDFEKVYNKEREYHKTLQTEQGRQRHLKKLRTDPISRLNYGRRIADRLEGKNSGLTITERMENQKVFNSKFTRTNEIKDEKKREEGIKKVLDEHFQDNGKGEKFFTESLEKKGNEDLKKAFAEALKESDKDKRKDEIIKVVQNLEERVKKEETTKEKGQASAKETPETSNTAKSQPTGSTNTDTNQDIKTKKTGVPTDEEKERIQTTKARLMEKYGAKMEKTADGQVAVKTLKSNVEDFRKKRQKIEEDQYQTRSLREAAERERKLESEQAKVKEIKDRKNAEEDFYKAVPELTKEIKDFSQALKETKSALLRDLKSHNIKPTPPNEATDDENTKPITPDDNDDRKVG